MERYRESERSRGFESLASREAVQEYLRDPENRAEIIAFWDYVQFLESLISGLIPNQGEVGQRELHSEFTRITVVSPQSSQHPQEQRSQQDASVAGADASGTVVRPPQPPRFRTIRVGDHMDVTLGYTAIDCWPDHDQTELSLTDGHIVTPDTPVGIIDYYRNIQRLNREGNLVEFSRALIGSAEESLQELARDYSATRSVADSFSGMSHLARLAHRFGFTVFDIVDERQRARATQTSFGIASGIAESNEQWNKLREKYKPAKIAVISGSELVRRFS